MLDPESPGPASSPADPLAGPRRRSAAAVPTDAVLHPLDQKALQALRQVPGLDDLVRFIFEKGFEKVWRIENLSSSVRVSDAHFPSLYRQFHACAERLGVHPVPPLFVRSGPLNAWTGGVEEPFVVLTSAMINVTTPVELDFVICHELGHIRCEHVLYNTLARQLPLLVQLVPVAGRFLSAGLTVALQEWSRRAELSCDRFGLLGAQDVDAGLRTMIKLAGAPYALYSQIDVAAFLAQYEEFERLDRDLASFLYRTLAEARLSHPWLVERAFLLKQWSDGGAVDRLLAGAPWEAAPRAPAMFTSAASVERSLPPSPLTFPPFTRPPVTQRCCAACGARAWEDQRYCEQCGTALPDAASAGDDMEARR